MTASRGQGPVRSGATALRIAAPVFAAIVLGAIVFGAVVTGSSAMRADASPAGGRNAPASSSTGGFPMTAATEPEELTWQGAAGRRPQRFLVARVTGVEREGGGLLGVRRSPSLNAVPDAHLVSAVTSGDTGRALRLRVPGADAAGLAEGATIVVGVVEGGRYICLLRPPAGMAADAIPAWAAGQPCGD